MSSMTYAANKIIQFPTPSFCAHRRRNAPREFVTAAKKECLTAKFSSVPCHCLRESRYLSPPNIIDTHTHKHKFMYIYDSRASRVSLSQQLRQFSNMSMFSLFFCVTSIYVWLVVPWLNHIQTHTHRHTHMYIYI